MEYTDGFGRLLQTRTQAETVLFGGNQFGDSGLPALQTDPNADAVGDENTTMTPNVVVSGWQSYNNKGAVVEKWEPFFDTGWDFDTPTSPIGVKVTQFYDPLGRVRRTLNPDATEQRVIFGVPGTVATPVLSSLGSFEPTPWQNYTYDANDLAPLTHPSDTTVPSTHHYTPRSVKVDALGRVMETTDRNYNGGAEEVVMKFFFDIRGNTVQVDDAIKNAGGSRSSAFLHVYDYANKPLKTTHIEKGTSTVVMNAAGLPVEMSDAKGAWVLNAYDALLRPTDIWAQDVTGEDLTLRQHIVYGEPEGDTLNHRGKPYKHYDEAGMVEFYGYDFKGNLVEKNRKVIKDSKILDVFDPPLTNWEVPVFRVDWTGLDESDMLETDDYETAYEYDALDRATMVRLPMDLDLERKEVRPTFNRAGALEAISLDGVDYVRHIAYNARGQRLLVAFGNDIMTRYAYHSDTFRLMRQRSEAYAHSVSGTTHTYEYQTGSLRQDNEYRYDLAGNIVWMKDGRSDSAAGGSGNLERDFEYDPLYRLLHETGRESTNYQQYADPSQVGNVNNGVANTRGYNRHYVYDRLGNMLQLSHVATGSSFDRDFNAYHGTTNPNPYETSNLATEIDYGGTTVNYSFDANGNQVSEGSSRHMEWDFGDRMRSYYTQTGTSEPSVYAHYLYSADGNRVKKLVRKSTGNEEVSVYIDGGFEYLYELNGTTRDEEMNEIHVMDGRSRIARAQVYGGTFGGSQTNAVLYNLEDHLGNSSFTLTAIGAEYSREEYFPFGETSFGCYGKKRYRFCGKERDEESGLYYYGARYCAAWSCRFVSVDPLAGKYPFYTPYQYAGNRSMVAIDLDGMEPSGNSMPSKSQTNGKTKGADGANQTDNNSIGRKKSVLNLYITEPLECTSQYGKNDVIRLSYEKAKETEKNNQSVNAELKKNGFEGVVIDFKVLEVTGIEDAIQQIESLMKSGKYELGDIFIDGHGGYDSPYAHIGRVPSTSETSKIEPSSFNDPKEMAIAKRFNEMSGPSTNVFLLHCAVAGGQDIKLASIFIKGLARELGAKVFGSMGPTSVSPFVDSNNTFEGPPYHLIDTAASTRHYAPTQLKAYGQTFMGTGVWRSASPNGALEMSHPIFIDTYGKVGFWETSDPTEGYRRVTKLFPDINMH